MSDAIPEDLNYTADHEWVRLEDGLARVGITDYAQEQLGDVVYVEVPKVGATVGAGKAMGVVESVKAASDILSPVSGTVVEVNPNLADHPEIVNNDPYESGWMLVISPSNELEFTRLLDAAGYAEVIAAE
jgi:glycine cleavage system H protein